MQNRIDKTRDNCCGLKIVHWRPCNNCSPDDLIGYCAYCFRLFFCVKLDVSCRMCYNNENVVNEMMNGCIPTEKTNPLP